MGPGTPGTIRIHPEGTPLPAPSPGAWGGGLIGEGEGEFGYRSRCVWIVNILFRADQLEWDE
jgi:hypothetical protein